MRLVDTAGLRKKAKVNEKLEKLSTGDTIRSITFAEVVLLVMDATHPFETQDLQIADLAEREGRCVVFVLAKWDLVEDPGATLKGFVEHAERMLPQLRGTPVVALSGETGKGVERLMPAVLKSHKDWSTKVKTRDLNDWLQMAMQRHPPPSVGGKRIKPKYMAQTKARPPTFVLFSSRADQMPEQYRRYPDQFLARELRPAGRAAAHHPEVGRQPLCRGRGRGPLRQGQARVRTQGAREGADPGLAQHRQEVGARGRGRSGRRRPGRGSARARTQRRQAGFEGLQGAQADRDRRDAGRRALARPRSSRSRSRAPRSRRSRPRPATRSGSRPLAARRRAPRRPLRHPVAGARTVRGNKAPPKGR